DRRSIRRRSSERARLRTLHARPGADRGRPCLRSLRQQQLEQRSRAGGSAPACRELLRHDDAGKGGGDRAARPRQSSDRGRVSPGRLQHRRQHRARRRTVADARSRPSHPALYRRRRRSERRHSLCLEQARSIALKRNRTVAKKKEVAMPRFLKRGMDASAIKAADAKVRETVESILAQIEERGDAAVRELSEKFDKWSPANFKLTPQEIETAIGQVGKRDLAD